MPQMSYMDATYHSAQDLIYAMQYTAPASPLLKLGQKKLQEVKQEGTQMKRAMQSKPITNAEPLRVPILESYPDELQPVNQAKNRYFQPIRSQHFTVTPKSEK